MNLAMNKLKTLLQILEQMLTELFKLAGYDEAFSQKTIAQALAYDKKLAPFQRIAQNAQTT